MRILECAQPAQSGAFNSIYQLLSFEKYKNETGQRVRQMHGQPGYL